MQYSFKALPKSEAEITVTLPFSEFEPQVKRAAVLISEEVEIEGFRRGKAPYDVVKNKIGEGKIYETASELAVKKVYSEILRKVAVEQEAVGKDFAPIGRPEVTVTKLAPGNELEFKIHLVLLPDISLPDYKKIAERVRKDKKDVGVDDGEVEKTLEWIRDSRSKLVTVDRPAREDDAVEVDFQIRDSGVMVEGGGSQNHPLIIGKSKFIPGFEEKLIGMHDGEEKQFTLLVPAEWHDKSLAGKMLDFSVTMKLVQERQRAGLDDEFARSLGDFASLDALKKSVRDGILKEKQEKESQRLRAASIEAIAKEVKADLPEVLVLSEIEKMIGEMKSGVVSMGMKWEDYLRHIKKSDEDLKKEWHGEAQRRVRAALALRAIAIKENVSVTEEEIKARANQFLRQYGSPEEAQKEINADELREYTRGILSNEKVFELLENS